MAALIERRMDEQAESLTFDPPIDYSGGSG
jgi:hypothetical protein